MDLNKIKEIVNNDWLSPDKKEFCILEILSEDKKVFSYLLQMLEFERNLNKNVIIDMNVNMSRLTYFAHMKKRSWFGPGFSFEFVVKELKGFYEKYKNVKEVGPRNNEEINIFPKFLKKDNIEDN